VYIKKTVGSNKIYSHYLTIISILMNPIPRLLLDMKITNYAAVYVRPSCQ